MAAARAGVTGEDVHRATIAAIVKHGYKTGLPPADAPDDYCAMTHGTGHGVGLECHEPPLLDFKGPELLEGELVTIEPGLYRRGIGGVRVEDIVLIHADRCESLNKLPEGLGLEMNRAFDRKKDDRKMECKNCRFASFCPIILLSNLFGFYLLLRRSRHEDALRKILLRHADDVLQA